MNSHSEMISRRMALHRTLAVAGGMSLPLLFRNGFGAEAEPTPENALGPFYPIAKPLDKDSDLTRIRGRKGIAKGQIIYVSGRVLNLRGEPVKNANLELWQANSTGRYMHPGDESALPLDPNFEGFALLKTNADGEFRFKTIKPGAYPARPGWERPPHIHFEVMSKVSRLVTQMFFPGEPLNSKDQLFTSLGETARHAVAALQPAGKDTEPGALSYAWNIVLFQK